MYIGLVAGRFFRPATHNARWPPEAARVVGRDELVEILIEAFNVWKSPAEFADYEHALNALGLWPADRNLYNDALAVTSEEIVGVYVPSKKELLLVSDPDDPQGGIGLSAEPGDDFPTEFALSHEIIHLLQHQAYPHLMDPDWVPNNSDDLETSIQATLEGDAMRFSFDTFGLEAPTPEMWAIALDGHSAEFDGSALSEAPALIALTFNFPYVRGYAVAWSEEEHLLDSPPISTEQLLHDDRRLEGFLQIDLTELEARFPAGCRVLQRNDVGELQISVLFRDLSEDPDPAIWEGWNGDRYLVADCAGSTEWVWWTAWDSEADAVEFENGYRKIAAAVAARASSELPGLARTDAIYVVVTSRGFAAEASKPPPRVTHVTDLRSLQELLRSQEGRAVVP